jgi:hypothetical protein
MKPLAAAAALVIAVAAGLAPAQARDTYVIDNAHLLSAATIAQINAKVGDFNAQTHKDVFVDTEAQISGTPQAAAERVFAQQQVNGVLIFVAKSPKTIGVVPDRAAARFFPSGSTSAIRDAIKSAFNSGDYNGGINNGVDLTLAEYRSHLGGVRSPVNTAPAPAVRNQTGGGFNMSWIFWLIALAVIFFIVRGIFRAIAGPRMMPPGYGGPMGGGYGPGYGGGGFGGGGGGFWSGMLGGLGGAFLGNELFGGGRGGEMFNQGGQQAGFGGEAGGYGGDASGFQSDAGQADMGNASFGGFGDSGGGGGWGDTGGGGGDFGGGGGDGGGGGW